MSALATAAWVIVRTDDDIRNSVVPEHTKRILVARGANARDTMRILVAHGADPTWCLSDRIPDAYPVLMHQILQDQVDRIRSYRCLEAFFEGFMSGIGATLAGFLVSDW